MSQSGNNPNQNKEEQIKALRQAALQYHEFPVPGKIAVTPTKQLTNQRDLALAYTPGVAAACEEIKKDPSTAFRYTARGNLVGVVTNGTAVLGLGDIGPLASKPVMEGKAVLFKKFAGIDVFDIEVNESDPEKLVEVIAALEPTFGGINLEDIKAPDCFLVERKLRERMKIPVFHDDQHGTAIVVAAAILNGLKVVGKDIGKVKLVTSGAGAAALACLELLVDLGLPKSNIWVTDIVGVVYEGRTELMDPKKLPFAQKTDKRNLGEAIEGADVFLGLSAGGVLKPEMVKRMADKPLVFALANPTPEILPEEVKSVRPDAVMATGRTDYPNQVNNVLCFPFIFRGALDVGATTITREMEIAAVTAIADLARAEQSDVVAAVYSTENLAFGPDYLIPKPFDPRLITVIAPAVAKAAMDCGVASRPIKDFALYKDQLQQFVYHSGTIMKPLFGIAKKIPAEQKRIVFCEGENERVMRAVQGSILLKKGHADGMICGTISNVGTHLKYIDEVIGHELGASVYGGMSGLILPNRQVFLVDTHVNVDPTASQLAEITLLAASEMRKLGMTPKVALLSHSNFGSSDAPSALKMREVLAILQATAPDLEVDGEMHGDCALDPEIRAGAVTQSRCNWPTLTWCGKTDPYSYPGSHCAPYCECDNLGRG